MSAPPTQLPQARLRQSFPRAVPGTLIVRLETGEEWDATRADVRRFGWVDPVDVVLGFTRLLRFAVRDIVPSGELPALTPLFKLLNLSLSGPLGELGEARAADPELGRLLDAVADLERRVRIAAEFGTWDALADGVRVADAPATSEVTES